MNPKEEAAQRLRRQAAELRASAAHKTQGGRSEDRLLRLMAQRLEENADRLERGEATQLPGSAGREGAGC